MKTKIIITSFIALSLYTLLYAAPKQSDVLNELTTEITESIEQQIPTYTANDLFEAVGRGDYQAVELIVNSKQVDIDSPHVYDEQTALMYASWLGYLEIADFLISKGANVNAVDHFLYTPLKLAIKYEHKEIVDLLIKNDAIIEDYYLLLAVHIGNSDIVDLLLENVSNVSSYDLLKEAIHSNYNECDTKVAKVLIKHGVNTEGALEWAKKWKCRKIIKLLENEPSVLGPVQGVVSQGQIEK